MEKTTSPLPFDNSPYILPLYKPSGQSSFDCIRDLKKHLFAILGKGKGRRKLKIGHFGTLDPFAEGVLLIGTGKALKLMKYFQEEMLKGYEATGNVKFSTDTGDCDGQMLKESNSLEFSEGDVKEVLKSFVGSYSQRPPYFSAVKHEGRPLYEWAREGVFIDKDPVARNILTMDFLGKDSSEVSFYCEVSSGTYIRGLWYDAAQKLGLEGHLVALKRTKWGQIDSDECLHGHNLDTEKVKAFLKRPAQLWSLPSLKLEENNAKKFEQGQFLPFNELPQPCDLEAFKTQARGWVYDQNSRILGLGEVIDYNGHSILKTAVSLI